MARPWVAVMAVLGLLGLLGGTLLNDYGLTPDDPSQRDLGHAKLDLALGDDSAFRSPKNFVELRYYGAAFEAPLALIERMLRQDIREIYLTRHLLTHLLFLVGAGAAALLAHRLFGGTWPALLALAAFALHPRLYAHSFFNTKDAPFAALFMVCLALAERAFRRGTPGAFAVLGVGVAVLVNLRVMGALLFVAVLAMCVLDAALARGLVARGRVIATGGAFAAATVVTLYVISPYLWPDPSRLVDSFTVLSNHPGIIPTLFAGTVVRWPNIPAHYVPTWVAITTPPALLALCLTGALAVLFQCLRQPRSALANAPPRFGLLLVACPALIVAAAVATNANVHNGWRHMHFLWAPASLLIVAAAKWLTNAGRRRAMRRGVWGLAAAGLTAAATQMALLHPLQHSYFNLLVDRDVPERLTSWYGMDRWRMFYYAGLRQVLQRHPLATVMDRDSWQGVPQPFPMLPKMPAASATTPIKLSQALPMLPEAQRRRVATVDPLSAEADILVAHRGERRGCGGIHSIRFAQHTLGGWPAAGLAPAQLAIRIYDNTCFTAWALDLAFMDEAPAAALRAAHRAAATGTPLARSGYDLHLALPGELTLLKEPCGDLDLRGEFALTAFIGTSDRASPDGGVESACGFADCGARIGDACMVRLPLPAGPLQALVAGQRLRTDGPDLWRAAVEFRPSGAGTVDATRPMVPPAPPLPADAPFDLRLDGDHLVYSRESCRPEDTWWPFFLHVFPKDPATLPEGRRESGFHNLDFEMERHDEALLTRFAGQCVAWRRLPGEGGGGIAYLRTGQLNQYGQQLWLAEFGDLP